MAKHSAKAIAGFFRTRAEGERAFQSLLDSGLAQNDVSMLVGDGKGIQPAVGPRLETGAETEAGRDTTIGGIAGLAVGMIAAVLPGIGPLLAIGPLAGAIGGLGIGAAAGGAVGLLRDHGIPEEEAEFLAEGVRRGGALVTVHGVSGDQAAEVRKLLDRNGAVDTEELGREWRSKGWKPGTAA